MHKPDRSLARSAAALSFMMLYCSPTASMQTAARPDLDAQLRATRGKFVTCGQVAVQKANKRPQSINEAKAVLGENCMDEFNDFMSVAAATTEGGVSKELANHLFSLAATELLPPINFAPSPIPHLSSNPAATSSPREAPPPTCHGSVNKGLKAYNSGNFELALCHWLPKANAGNALAQNNIGLLFERGLSVQTPQSDARAAEWFFLAAQQGNSTAMRNLAAAQIRLGHQDTAQSWSQLADATDQQNQAIREQQRAQSVAILIGGLACAFGACPTMATPYGLEEPRVDYSAAGSTQSIPVRAATPAVRATSRSGAQIRVDTPSGRAASPGVHMCADGSYVAGTCRMAPDGTYVGGNPRMAPDGSYVAGTPRLAPNGSYVGGQGRMIMCPDGTYVVGERCQLTPSGKYVGQ